MVDESYIVVRDSSEHPDHELYLDCWCHYPCSWKYKYDRTSLSKQMRGISNRGAGKRVPDHGQKFLVNVIGMVKI